MVRSVTSRRERERQTGRQAGRQTDSLRQKQRELLMWYDQSPQGEREKDRQTGRQTDTQTDRLIDREIDRRRDRERERESGLKERTWIWERETVCLFVGCLTSQQHASVSQGRICTDNFTCCHTEIEVADQTFHLTQSQYTDTGPTSPSADPISPGAWQGSLWSANV